MRRYLSTLALLVSLAFLCVTTVAMISAIVVGSASPYSFPWCDLLALVVLSAVATVYPTQWIQKRLRERRALNRIRAGKCNACGASTPDQERTLDYGISGPSKTGWISPQAVTLTLAILTFVATLLYTGDLALRWCMLNLWK